MSDERAIVARVTIENLEDNTTETRELPAGDYLIVVTNPCRLDSMQSYRGGQTVVLTLKDRVPSDG